MTTIYNMQILGQMAICKKDYCDFMCWTPMGMHVEPIAIVFTRIKPSLDHYFQSIVLPELLTHAIQDGYGETEMNYSAAKSSPGYCLCGEKEHGHMVACDNPHCTVEWFHNKCVGITRKPQGKRYCPSCISDLA